jgi:ABC-type uncharacterized transport system substrate-binding protein
MRREVFIRILTSGVAMIAVMAPSLAVAHPHVWVAVEATVAYGNGTVTGLQQRWTFDDMYTAMAVQGLDKDGDGKYTREELQDLAKVNIEGIEQFAFFTHAKLGEEERKFVVPTDYWLEYNDNVLTLNFMLPLEQPVAATSPGFSFSIYDPTYFIAFDFAKEAPLKLGAGAPQGCAINVKNPMSDAEAKSLADAFASELGPNDGSALARTVLVDCARS